MFYEFWIGTLWGSPLLAFFGTAAILILIGLLGRWSQQLLLSMMLLYALTFGIFFKGIIIFVLAMIGCIGFLLFKLVEAFT